LSDKSRNAALALLLLVPAQSIATVLFCWHFETVAGKIAVAVLRLWIVVLPFLWLKWVDREKTSWSPPKIGGFGVAIAWGIAISAVIFTAYAASLHLGAIKP
jgi:hypothetical protein